MTLHQKRLSGLVLSAAAHVGLAAAALLLLTLRPAETADSPPPISNSTLIYIPQPAGPVGGGGGRTATAAPARLEIPSHRPAEIVPVAIAAPPAEPPPVLDVPVQTAAASLPQNSGSVVTALPGPAGRGTGVGLGDGKGPGLGPGEGGRTGGGPMQVGGDVLPPVPYHQPRPNYTPGAMQAKRTGEVTIEAVVLADGSVGQVRLITSLDRVFGLDEEAIRTAKLWRFKPATLHGKPVDVLVRFILQFRIY
jgi:protein TonB